MAGYLSGPKGRGAYPINDPQSSSPLEYRHALSLENSASLRRQQYRARINPSKNTIGNGSGQRDEGTSVVDVRLYAHHLKPTHKR